MACALLQREGAFSAPQCAWDAGTTQQSKRNGTIGAKERKKRNNNQKVNFKSLAVKYLAIPATSAPSERIWSRAARVLTVKRNRMSEEVTSAMMYCRENRELLHKYYAEIARERMHPDDHHLIKRQQALLPTFENEDDADSKIDVGVDEDKEL